jgi:hypothetical protein
MLAAAGDPFLALWLVTGRLVTGSPATGSPATGSPATGRRASEGSARGRPVTDGPGPSGGSDGYVPPELRGAGAADLATATAAARFAALQRAVKRASTRGALGPLPWPGALGTPPWGAARTARFPGAAYTSVLVDDTDRGHLAAVLDRADAALAAGVPVPLYTGGDLATGPATAVPRHVVLLVPPRSDRPTRHGEDHPAYTVYEPAGGRLHAVTRGQLLAPSGPREALGRWAHVCWAVLPVAQPPGAVRPTAVRPAAVGPATT